MARSARPPSQEPARMGALATLPVFLKLEGRRVVISGGSEAVTWKAELFAAAGARVEVHALEPCEALVALAAGREKIAIRPGLMIELPFQFFKFYGLGKRIFGEL